MNGRRLCVTGENLMLVLVVGSFPIIASTLIATAVGSPRYAVAPLFGFCPIDFLHVSVVPPPADIHFWACVLVMVAVLLGIVGFFKTPAALLYIFFVWGSVIVLICRVMIAIQGMT